jgi:transcriptional regulator with XRE-family HTH domain
LSNFLKLVGEQIRFIRKAKGLTQEVLAEKSGLSFSYVSDVERGERNISLESLEKIIVALEVSPNEIFKFKDVDVGKGFEDKRIVIEVLKSLLMERNIDEVKFVLKVARDFVDTVDKMR